MVLKRGRRVFVFASVITFGIAACGKKEKDKTEEEVPTIGSLQLKPVTVFDTVATSLVGLGTGMTGIGGAASLHMAEEGPFKCDTERNEPIDAKDPSKNSSQGALPETDPRYGTFKLACVLSGKSGNSTSISGSFQLPRVFGCALSSLNDLAFDGVERDAKIPVTRDCFGDLLDDPDAGIKEGDEVAAKVTLSRPAATEGWDYSIGFKTVDTEILMNFAGDLSKNLAFSIYQRGQQPWGDDGISLAVDFEKGEIRYVYRRDITNCDGKTGDDLKTCFGPGESDKKWEGTNNLALLAKGSFNNEKEFTLADIHGAHMRAYADREATPRKYHARIFTLSGNLTTGATQRAYFAAPVAFDDFIKAASFPEETSHNICFKDQKDPVAGSCADNEGVKLVDDKGTVFTIHPGDARHPRNKEWFGHAPLSFTSIDLSNTVL